MAEKIRINRVTSNLQSETGLDGCFRSCRLEERMRHYSNPGISITVVDGGKIAWSGGFGYKDARTREKVVNDTMFLSGSISKPVFSLAVVKLAETRLIDLDRDVNEYLKRWRVPSRGSWQPRVTLRQLLSHTAGTTVQGFPGYKRSGSIPGVVEILKGLPPSNTDPVMVNIIPGTLMRYSGGGIVVAQTVIEDAVGIPFARCYVPATRGRKTGSKSHLTEAALAASIPS
ncbi:MAG: penicillin-binding protein beta-lactamase class C [Elusimicrobia bacterium]|nr:MAG: penicillin-binding protein beta-lactamase class C [Elusimicrobiota bacterium]KAF0155501.1 MAG: penicillin-binding protein beta-lactamase class C [Elusimicrobiota bacterium]